MRLEGRIFLFGTVPSYRHFLLYLSDHVLHHRRVSGAGQGAEESGSVGAYVPGSPSWVAGPIVKYKDISGQLADRNVTAERFSYGISRFITGLSKKVFLANNIGMVWEQISGGNLAGLSAAEAWIGAAAFSFQIYFDFSGYSDMAIGLGELFGFHFQENFNYPYRSKSMTEFWRRWHISLGTWFREYVYIPLGGSRKGMKRQLRNLLIVWCLTGLWHGASWNFLVWGLYFGVFLTAEKLFLLRRLEALPGVGFPRLLPDFRGGQLGDFCL